MILARAAVAWGLALGLGMLLGCSSAPSPAAALRVDATATPAPHTRVRAFYSGHSLTDGVPEVVDDVARSRGGDFDYQFQSIVGSLLRSRTRGDDLSAAAFTGYQQGRNRSGTGLDVAAELRTPKTLKDAGPYDTLVVTERHDLPWTALHEATPTHLAHLVTQLAAGNPDARTFLAHTWLGIRDVGPEVFIRYEREVLPLWECVASSANRLLTASGVKAEVRVLPGATALARLVEDLLAGRVPDAPQDEQARLDLLFSDDVHLSDTGRYFIGLVHYAALFGQSPEGAAAPAGVTQPMAAYMQRLAWQHVEAYAQVAQAAAKRDMGECRRYAARTVCASYYEQHFPAKGIVTKLKGIRELARCESAYEDASDARNPFR